MLAGWIFKAGDFIEGLMVQLKDYRIGNRLHFCIVDNPSKLANLSRYLKANLGTDGRGDDDICAPRGLYGSQWAQSD